MAAAVADGTNCVILRHHGCARSWPTWSTWPCAAAVNLEEAARLTYQALLLGRPIVECPMEFGDSAASDGFRRDIDRWKCVAALTLELDRRNSGGTVLVRHRKSHTTVGRRHRRRSRLWYRLRVTGTIMAVGALVVIGAVAVHNVSANASSCVGQVQVAVAATPEIAPPLQLIAADWMRSRPQVDGRCVQVNVPTWHRPWLPSWARPPAEPSTSRRRCSNCRPGRSCPTSGYPIRPPGWAGCRDVRPGSKPRGCKPPTARWRCRLPAQGGRDAGGARQGGRRHRAGEIEYGRVGVQSRGNGQFDSAGLHQESLRARSRDGRVERRHGGGHRRQFRTGRFRQRYGRFDSRTRRRISRWPESAPPWGSPAAPASFP